MAEFTPITFNTQEEYDNAFKERISRVKKGYEGYTSPEDLQKLKDEYQKQIDELTSSASAQTEKYKDFDAKLKERDAKIAQYEADSVKTRMAVQYGIPLELVGKISGSTPEEIEEDAKKLASFVAQPSAKASPGFKASENDSDAVTKRFLELNPTLKL